VKLWAISAGVEDKRGSEDRITTWGCIGMAFNLEVKSVLKKGACPPRTIIRCTWCVLVLMTHTTNIKLYARN